MNQPFAAGRPALDLCDEAVHLLRRAPASALIAYYGGSIPFVLGFLFFCADMSSSATAHDHIVSAAFGLALLYLWMIAWQAVFVRRLRSAPGDRLSFAAWMRLLAAQAAIQPTKLVALPLALLLTIPFPATYAFYHSAGVTGSFSSARKLAALWPRQSLEFLGILALFSLVVFVNVAMALLTLPYLAKLLLGIDTAFTRSSYTFLNTTFLAVVAGLSYLVLNPFVKAFYTLRGFYGESLTTAEDLRVELRASTASILCLVAVLGAPVARAENLAGDLDHSIDRVLKRPEYAWRLPRAPRADDQNQNWFVRTTLSFLDATDRSLKQMSRWVDRMAEWLGDRFGNRRLSLPDQPNTRAPAGQLRMALVLLLAVIAGIAVYLLWRLLAAPRAAPAPALASPAAAIDLESEDLYAAQRPLDQWLELAKGCIERQEFRLALRALYLAGLSLLASETLIGLDRSKSDRDYARELTRRARHRPTVISAFAENLRLFERGWYGMYDVNLATISECEANLERMRARAQQ